MSKLLISRKGNVSVTIKVVSIAMVCAGLLIFATGGAKSSWRDSDIQEVLRVAAPVLLIMLGLAIWATTKGSVGRTYINLYSDRVEGIGINNGGAKSFIFTQSQDYKILKNGKQINVFYNGTGYAIPLTEEDAQAVYNCWQSGIPDADPNGVKKQKSGSPKIDFSSFSSKKPPVAQKKVDPDPDRIFVYCTNCGAKCRVPKGKGTIRIKCPACSKDFIAKT